MLTEDVTAVGTGRVPDALWKGSALAEWFNHSNVTQAKYV